MDHLFITEIFKSIQGETSLVGFPTTFIRTSGCNLRCTWCDTPYSFSKGKNWTHDAIVEKVKEFECKHVCVTGGEPLLQSSVLNLMKTLCDLGFYLSIETGGSLTTHEIDPRVKIILDIKCPDSGMSHKNLWLNLKHLRPHDEIKFVINGREDYVWAKKICDKFDLWNKHLLFSPVFNVLDPKTLVQWILEDSLPVRLNLQIHKFIWDPSTIGV